MRRLCLAMFMAVGLLGTTPGAASSAEDGVTVDRDSPAGKEYALPFPEARKKGAGDDGSPGDGASGSAAGSAAADPPLFGAGISPSGGGAVDAPGFGGGIGSTSPLPPGTAQPPVSGSVGGSSATLMTGAIVAAVLLAGTVIGLTMRRRNARSEADA